MGKLDIKRFGINCALLNSTMDIQSATEHPYQYSQIHERFKKALAIIGNDLKAAATIEPEAAGIEKRIKKLNHAIRTEIGKTPSEELAHQKHGLLSFKRRLRRKV